jgi:SAM-dependent methyltransferase
MTYQDINKKTIDKWVDEGWIWGIPIDHDTYVKATKGDWSVVLTPTKPVPKNWFPPLKGKHVLGLASGGGQQMPIFAALGAICTVLDNSKKQLATERLISEREGYPINIIEADMSKKLPFADETFDVIFHPVANVYVEDVNHVFRECNRVLKKNGVLLSGLDNGMNFIFDETEERVIRGLPFNPEQDPNAKKICVEGDWGMQFSHTLEEQIGGQLRAGFIITDLYEDTNGEGRLHELGIPMFFATRSIKS